MSVRLFHDRRDPKCFAMTIFLYKYLINLLIFLYCGIVLCIFQYIFDLFMARIIMFAMFFFPWESSMLVVGGCQIIPSQVIPFTGGRLCQQVDAFQFRCCGFESRLRHKCFQLFEDDLKSRFWSKEPSRGPKTDRSTLNQTKKNIATLEQKPNWKTAIIIAQQT